MEYTVELETTPGAGSPGTIDSLLAPLTAGRTSVTVLGPVLGQDSEGRVHITCQVDAGHAQIAVSKVAQALRDAYAASGVPLTWLVESITCKPTPAD